MTNFVEALEAVRKTNVTNIIHHEPYAAISPTLAQLSQHGRTILITGGGTGIGFAIAQSFIRASASTIIIVSRRPEVLETARLKLEEEAASAGTGTSIIAKTCDLANNTEVDALWSEFNNEGVFVDVYIANAAAFTEVYPMMELGFDNVWSQVDVNMKAPMYFTEKFCKQVGERHKFILNVSTANIHSKQQPAVACRPAYNLSKLAGTLFFQLLAQEVSSENVQVISFHPGLIYNAYFKGLGIDPKHFDNDQLAGAFAVWAASKEAAFLHGRFVWSSWDVDELATGPLRKRIDEDFYFLRVGVSGLSSGNLA